MLLAAVFAFGPVSEVDRYPESIFPAGRTASLTEIRLRSPIHWLEAISTPTYVIEGRAEPSNIDELDEIRRRVRNTQVHCVRVPGATHFSVLERVGRVLGPRLATGTAEGELLGERNFGS